MAVKTANITTQLESNNKEQTVNSEVKSRPNEKHLEFLQNNINRMNQCSFQMKGWTITIASALITIFVSTISSEHPGNKIYLFAAIAASTLFWCLDSLYLSKERKFIGIYNDVIGVGNGENRPAIVVKEYEIPVEKYNECYYCIFRAMVSTSEAILYGAIIAGLIVLCIVA